MLKLLSLEDQEAVFDFENRNKEWFERWVPPRPNAYFDPQEFSRLFNKLVEEMSETTYLLFVKYHGDQIIGRFNFPLIDVEQGEAEIGYRVCQAHIGRGIATNGLNDLKQFARENLCMKRLAARVSLSNTASCKVLLRHHFVQDPVFEERLECDGKLIVLHKFLLDLQ